MSRVYICQAKGCRNEIRLNAKVCAKCRKRKTRKRVRRTGLTL